MRKLSTLGFIRPGNANRDSSDVWKAAAFVHRNPYPINLLKVGAA